MDLGAPVSILRRGIATTSGLGGGHRLEIRDGRSIWSPVSQVWKPDLGHPDQLPFSHGRFAGCKWSL